VASLGRVAVLLGGTSAEREVSLMSGGGVLKALQSQGVDAFAFDPAERPLQALRDEGVDRCFIALHGRGGEDGTVQGALELLGIAYTGSGVMASSIAMDKVMTKRIWRFEGLPTPDWRLVGSVAECEHALVALGAPMIVKPAREGSSIGLSKVTDAGQCAAAYAAAAQHDPEVLCEQFIEGEETTCPVLIVNGEAQALPVIRIVAPGGNYDYQNKYFSDEVKYLCPSQLGADEEAEIQRQVLRAFNTLGCRGWARADVMIRRSDRQPFLLEINTSPGMTGHSLVPMSARVAGLSYEQLCVHLLASATLDART
jgi:D-alanine-D-alanine ligase